VFYSSVIIALFLACLSFKSVWLEMRVNIGLLVPVYAAVVFTAIWFALKGHARIKGKHKLLAVGNLIATGMASIMVLGPESIKVVPAAIIREGLGLIHTRFLYINLALCAFIVAGLILILVQRVGYER
jgi:hypothetical protein